jgi:hypothetical protein
MPLNTQPWGSVTQPVKVRVLNRYTARMDARGVKKCKSCRGKLTYLISKDVP